MATGRLKNGCRLYHTVNALRELRGKGVLAGEHDDDFFPPQTGVGFIKGILGWAAIDP
jgi:hypothetical protein